MGAEAPHPRRPAAAVPQVLVSEAKRPADHAGYLRPSPSPLAAPLIPSPPCLTLRLHSSCFHSCFDPLVPLPLPLPFCPSDPLASGFQEFDSLIFHEDTSIMQRIAQGLSSLLRA